MVEAIEYAGPERRRNSSVPPDRLIDTVSRLVKVDCAVKIALLNLTPIEDAIQHHEDSGDFIPVCLNAE